MYGDTRKRCQNVAQSVPSNPKIIPLRRVTFVKLHCSAIYVRSEEFVSFLEGGDRWSDGRSGGPSARRESGAERSV